MPTRYPGVTRQDDGRVLIRWTVRTAGQKVNRKRLLPESTTLAEAARLRADLLKDTVTEVRTGQDNEKRARQGMTLGAYARQWIEQRGPSFKASTLDNWQDALVHHILPHLGAVKVGDLRRHHLQEWVSKIETATFVPHTARPKKVRQDDGTMILIEPKARRYAKESIMSWWAKLRQIVKDAAADAEIPDPTLRVQPPKCTGRPKIRERRTLSFPELQALLDAIPTGWHAETFIDAMVGPRPGELYALEWDRDVDFERRRFRIAWGHVRGVLSTTKGEPRDVPFGEHAAEILLAHRRTLIRQQHPGLESGLVFPASEWSPKRGWYRMSGSLLKTLARASKAVGLEIRVTPNVLRRTWNTLMIEQGVDRLVTQSIIGHVDDEMTERYHHSRWAVRSQVVQDFESQVVSLPVSNAGTPDTKAQKKPRKSGA
jgi:integrase